MSKEWTQVDDIIMNMMQTFPRLFPSKVECWIYLFTSYGGGYEWDLETGLLYYPQHYRECFKDYPKVEDGPHFEQKFKHDEVEDKFRIFQRTRTNMLIQYTWDNIKTAVQDYHHSTCERHITDIHCMNWSDKNGKYGYSPALMQQACDNIDKINRKWRYEISYFCKWVTGEIRRWCYCPSSQDEPIKTDKQIIKILDKCSHIRKMSEMRTAFITATKVLDGIFTDEEKEQHKQNEIDMIKLVKEVIAQHKIEREEKAK